MDIKNNIYPQIVRFHVMTDQNPPSFYSNHRLIHHSCTDFPVFSFSFIYSLTFLFFFCKFYSPMSPIMSSQGMALATAMAAVSGTVILLAFRLQKSVDQITTQFYLDQHLNPHNSHPVLRSCISSGKSTNPLGVYLRL